MIVASGSTHADRHAGAKSLKTESRSPPNYARGSIDVYYKDSALCPRNTNFERKYDPLAPLDHVCVYPSWYVYDLCTYMIDSLQPCSLCAHRWHRVPGEARTELW